MRKPRAMHSSRRARHNTNSLLCAMLLALVCLVVPLDSLAACDASGLFTLGGGSGKCDATQTGIMSSVLCLFENALAKALSTMYCGFQTNIKSPLTALMSMMIAVFGVSVVAGYTRLTYKEAAIVILKLAVVFAVATNSDYGIKIVAKLSMAVLQQGTAVALAPLGGNLSLTQPDDAFSGFFGLMLQPDLTLANACSSGECLNKAVLAVAENCVVVLAVLGMTLLFFMPVVVVFIVSILLQYLKLFVYSFLNYLTSVVLLTFLFILSPLFFCFFLFKITTPLFERWIQYIISFSIQSVILFSFLAILGIVSQFFTTFFYGLLLLLRPYDITLNAGLMTIPIPNGCSICEYQVDTDVKGIKRISCRQAMQSGMYSNTQMRIVTPKDFAPSAAVDGFGTLIPTMLNGNPIDYKLKQGSVLSSVENPVPTPATPVPTDAMQNGGRNYVIPLQNLLKETDFLYYLLANLIAFWVIAKLMQEFIQKAPELADSLSGVMSHGLSGKSGYDGGINFPGVSSIPGVRGDIFDYASNAFASSMKTSQIFQRNGGFFRRVGAGMLGVTGAGLIKAAYGKGASAFAGSQYGTYAGGSGSEPFAGSQFGAYTGVAQMSEEQVAKEREERERREKEAQKKVDDSAKELQVAREENELRTQEMKAAQDRLERVKTDVEKGKVEQIELMTANLALKQASVALEASSEKVKARKRGLDQKKQDLSNIQYLQKRNPLPGAEPSKGLLGPQYAKGNVLQPSGNTVKAGSVLAGSAVLAGVQKKRDDKKKDQMKGRQVFDDRRGDTVSPGVSRKTNDNTQLLNAQQDASDKIAVLERNLQTYGSLLDPADREKFQRVIEKTKANLGDASSARDVQASLYELGEVETAFSKFSGKNIMQDAANSGAAGVALYLSAASGTIPSVYLQPAAKSVAKIQKEAKQAQNDQQLESVVKDIQQVPGQLMNAAINASEAQYADASRIVPEETLLMESAQVRKAEADAQNAKTTGEQMTVVKSLRDYPDKLVTRTVEVLGAQQDIAHSLVSSEWLKDIDKQLDGARERLKHAQTGDQYNMILQELVAAPTTLLKGVINGLEDQAASLSSSVSEYDRESIQKALEDAKIQLGTAQSGQDFDAVLHSLVDVSKTIKANQEEGSTSSSEGSPAAQVAGGAATSVVAGPALTPSGNSTSGFLAALGIGHTTAGAKVPVTPYGQSDEDLTQSGRSKLWRSSQDAATSLSNSWDAAKQRASGFLGQFKSVEFHEQPQAGPSISQSASSVWNAIKERAAGKESSATDAKAKAPAAPVQQSDHSISGLWNDVKEGASDMKDRAGVFTKQFTNIQFHAPELNIRSGINQVWDSIKERATGAGERATEIANRISNAKMPSLDSGMSTLVGNVTQIAATAFSGIQGLGNAGNSADKTAQNVSDKPDVKERGAIKTEKESAGAGAGATEGQNAKRERTQDIKNSGAPVTSNVQAEKSAGESGVGQAAVVSGLASDDATEVVSPTVTPKPQSAFYSGKGVDKKKEEEEEHITSSATTHLYANLSEGKDSKDKTGLDSLSVPEQGIVRKMMSESPGMSVEEAIRIYRANRHHHM